MRTPGDILVLSCYELGHQPVAAASALSFLERAGFRPTAIDLSVEPHDRERYGRARMVAVAVPMHTALRIGVAAARRIRRARPDAHVCFFGLYAQLNASYLFDSGLVDSVIGGEFEEPLVALARALDLGADPGAVEGLGLPGRPAAAHLARLEFAVPSRTGLPSLERYARLEDDGGARWAGAVEASRGCLHGCRHCPIPPVYGRRFFVVPRDVVLADVRQLVDAGATHVTFADADFLNGPTHARRLVREIHCEFPELTFDFTTKVEHVLKHAELFPDFAAHGCLFVVSAVESLNDAVLEQLDKGHRREDAQAALSILRAAGIALRPSFVPFTPWETLVSYGELLDWIERERLIPQVDPVQLSIRLLVPPGSLLLEREAMRSHLSGLDAENFSWHWEHPDRRMDALQRTVSALVQAAARRGEDAAETFALIRRAWAAAAGREFPRPAPIRSWRELRRPPRLTEPWFC